MNLVNNAADRGVKEGNGENWSFILRTIARNGELMRYKQSFFLTYKDAVLWAAEFYLRFDRDDITLTMDQMVFDYYIAPMRELYGVVDDCDLPSTVKTRVSAYKRHVSPRMGWRRLRDLRPEEFLRLYDSLIHLVSPHLASTALGSAFTFLEMEAFTDRLDLAERTKLPAAIALLTGQDNQMYCAIGLHLQRALPIKTVLAVEKSDFDVESKTLCVNIGLGGKMKRSRRRIPEALVPALESLLESTPPEKKPFHDLTESKVRSALVFAAEAYRL